jgi:hypothetical protein
MDLLSFSDVREVVLSCEGFQNALVSITAQRRKFQGATNSAADALHKQATRDGFL